MEELRGFNHRKEQGPVAVQSELSCSSLFHASRTATSKPMPLPYAAELPSDLIPPSTPSPRDPFVQLDSTSTASLSHLVPQSHVSLHDARQPPLEQTPAGSDSSSLSPCEPACTPVHKVSIASSSQKRVSLEQHLQCGDVGRDEAMQSFILQRFLPAAKTVAADHDCTMGKDLSAAIPSTTPRSSLLNTTPRTAPLHVKKGARPASTPNASREVAWSHPVSFDDGEIDSVNHDEAAKFCGVFCVDMKTAVSRAHDVLRTSGHTMSERKSRGALPSAHGASSVEEAAQLKSKVMTQDARSSSSESLSASVFLSSTSPATITMPDVSTRCAASPRTCPAGNALDSCNYVDSRPSLNLCIKCHSNRALHQPPVQGLQEEHGSHSVPNYSSVESSRRFNDLCPDAGVSSCSGNTTQASSMFSLYDHASCNAAYYSSLSRQDLASKTRSKENLVQHNLFEGALVDCYIEGDEPEFYDALSRFDVSNTTPAKAAIASKSQNGSLSLHKCTTCQHTSVETHHAYGKQGEILAFDADGEGHTQVHFRQHSGSTDKESGRLAPTAAFKKCGSVFQSGNDMHAQSLHDAYSGILNACQISAPDGLKKSLSSTMLGWPLGISSIHSTTSKNLREKTKNPDDNCAAKMKVQPARMAYVEEKGRRGRGYAMNLNPCTNEALSEEGQKDCVEQCITNISSFSNLSSPPVPPSPTSSWLGKALALRASKPSHLAILQHEEKVVSAKKKLEFSSASDTKKGVRWEDVVKGSQMHPEQFSFSEEICRHHHPTN